MTPSVSSGNDNTCAVQSFCLNISKASSHYLYVYSFRVNSFRHYFGRISCKTSVILKLKILHTSVGDFGVSQILLSQSLLDPREILSQQRHISQTNFSDPSLSSRELLVQLLLSQVSWYKSLLFAYGLTLFVST